MADINPGIYEYTEYHKEPAGLHRLNYVITQIQRYKGDPQGIRILDFGCGRGNNSLPLAALGYKVTGLDLDKATIQDVNQRNKFSNANFIVSSIEELDPFKPFDVIVATEVLEHMTSPSFTLESIYAYLKPDGLLVGSIPAGYSVIERIRKLLNSSETVREAKNKFKHKLKTEEFIQTISDSPHVQFFSKSNFTKLLQAGNYDLLDIRPAAIWFDEFYYTLGRFFIKRGSPIFKKLDKIDAKMSNQKIFKPFASGWLFTATKK